MGLMAKIGYHLHQQNPLPTSLAFSLLQSHIPLYHLHFRTVSIRSHHIQLLSPWPLHHVLRSRQWDFNAESLNFDGDDDDESEAEQWAEVLEDYIDSIWIIKVFRSFGWMLPFIIISMLLTTGLKAFLLALAVPVGQSTFAFAIQRFLNRGKIKPKPKTKSKASRARSRVYNSSRNVKFKATAERVRQEARKKKTGHQSWGSKNDSSVNRTSRNVSDFGGWDELDEVVMESNARSASGFERVSTEKDKSRKWRTSDGPLFLRLLISAFPFLSFLSEIV